MFGDSLKPARAQESRLSVRVFVELLQGALASCVSECPINLPGRGRISTSLPSHKSPGPIFAVKPAIRFLKVPDSRGPKEGEALFFFCAAEGQN